MKKVLPYLSNEIKSAKSKGVWGHYDIPIFSVSTMHEFNLNETRFSNIFIEKRVSSRLESLERSGLFLFAAFLYLLQNSQNSKLIFLCKVVI